MTIRNKKISQVRFDATNLNAPTVNRALDNVINTVNPFIDEVAQQLNNLEAASGTGQITINPENAASVTNSTFNLYGTNGITFGSNGINSITISQATSSLTLNVSGANTLTGSQFNLTGANGVTFSTPNSSTLVISQSLNTPVTINGNTGSITANPINIIAEGCCIHTETSGSDTLIISSSAPCNFIGSDHIEVITPQTSYISGSQPNTILLAHLDTNLAFGAFASPDTGQAGTEHPYPSIFWYGQGATGLDTTTWKFGGGAASTNGASNGAFYCRTDGYTSSLGQPYLQNVDGTSGDFTYECWIYPVVTTGYGFQNFMGIGKYGAGGVGFGFYMYLGALAMSYPAQPGGVAIPYTFTNPNEWYAVAISRKGNVTRVYVNGGLVATYTGLDFGQGNDLAIGGQSPYGYYIHVLQGNVDEVRYSNVAHYTGSSYTTASVAFPDYSGTVVTVVDDCTRQFYLTGAICSDAVITSSYPCPQYLNTPFTGATDAYVKVKNQITTKDIWLTPADQIDAVGKDRQNSIGLRGIDADQAIFYSWDGGDVKLLGGTSRIGHAGNSKGGNIDVKGGAGGGGTSGIDGGPGGDVIINGGVGGGPGVGANYGATGSILVGNNTQVINIGNTLSTTTVSGTFIAPIGGDVSGTTNATTVTKWQNLPVLNVSGTVANGQVYTWNNSISKWATYQDGLVDSNVIIQLPMSGTNGSTTFTNIAPVAYPVSAFGNTAITTSVEKWTGSGSAYFDGNGDYLTGSYNSALQFGTNDWTSEFWVNPNSGYGSAGFSVYAAGLVDFRSTGTSAGFLTMVTTAGNIAVWWAGGPAVLTSVGTIPTGSWSNVVVQRRNPNLEIYINGTLDSSVNIGSGYNQTDGQLAVGAVVNVLTPAGVLQYDGYMSDLRVSNIARYTGSFTTASAPFPNPVSAQTPNIAGDISGTLNAITVTGIQGNPITASTPSSGSSLIWNGSVWAGGIPATASFATSASFATTASWANTANATQIQGIPVTASAPADGNILVYASSSNTWVNQNTRYYGVFCDLTTQTASATTAAYPMKLNTTEEALGVSIVSGSQITFAHAGTYNIQFSAQVIKSNASNANIDIWLAETGSNVPRSNTTLHIQGNGAAVVAAWNFVRTFASGSYAEILWRTDDTNVELLYQNSSSSPTRPEIPSVIVSVTQV